MSLVTCLSLEGSSVCSSFPKSSIDLAIIPNSLNSFGIPFKRVRNLDQFDILMGNLTTDQAAVSKKWNCGTPINLQYLSTVMCSFLIDKSK